MPEECAAPKVLPITIDELTTGQIDGTGVFDEILKTMQVRLDDQYSKNRIKGTDYSNVYLGSMKEAMSQSILFLLGKDKAYNEALLIQAQAEKTEVEKCLIEAQCKKTNAETLLIEQQVLNLIQEEKNLEQQVLKSEQEVLVLEQEVLKSTQEVKVLEQKVLESVQQVLLIQEQVKNAGYEGIILQVQDEKVIAETSLIGKQGSKTDAETSLTDQKRSTEVNTTKLVGQKYDTEVKQTVLVQNQGSKVISEKTLVDKKSLTETKTTILVDQQGDTEIEKTELTRFQGFAALGNYYQNQDEYSDSWNKWNFSSKTLQDVAFGGKAVLEKEILEATLKKIEHEAWAILNDGYIKQAQVLDDINIVDCNTGATSGLHVNGVLGAQREKIIAEQQVLVQKRITEMCNFDETPDGGPAIQGILGAQIALYKKQKDGFDRTAEAAMAKISADGYAVQRGTDETLTPPGALGCNSVSNMITYAQNMAVASAGTHQGNLNPTNCPTGAK